MTTRELPQADWSRLAGTELEQVWPVLPDGSRIVVVERGDVIVGCWAVIPYMHVEGVWVHPDYRGRGRVAALLLRATWSTLRGMGVRSVLTAALTEQIRGLVAHLGGVPLPGDHFVLPVEQEKRCQP